MAPIDELLSGAGLCFETIRGNWAAWIAGSVPSGGPHSPAGSAHLQEAASLAHSGLSTFWASSDNFGAVSLCILPSGVLGEGESLLRMAVRELESVPRFPGRLVFWCSLQAGGPGCGAATESVTRYVVFGSQPP